MKQIGLTWQVDPEQLEPYKEIHLNPWPELIDALQAAGIHNYNIFMFGTRAFAYLEVDDDDSMARVQEAAIMDKWNEKVLPWVAPEAEEGSGIQFMALEQIFFCP
ncbi:MAG: L-rhamnose mutarotase [Chloroflexi bacterium]|nr:L-rhamnose mutarotase [Chloroflexota bacterium]